MRSYISQPNYLHAVGVAIMKQEVSQKKEADFI